jgi:hypothetical protein
MPEERFRSKESYRKFNAYRHIHGIPAPHLDTVVVAGKRHKVKHSKLSRPGHQKRLRGRR